MESFTTTALRLALVGAFCAGCGGISKDDPDTSDETSEPPSDTTTITLASGDVSVDATTEQPPATLDTETSSPWTPTSAAETDGVVTTSDQSSTPSPTTEGSTTHGTSSEATSGASTGGVETSDMSVEPSVTSETLAPETVAPVTSSPASEPAATTGGNDTTPSDPAATTGETSTSGDALTVDTTIDTTDDATSTDIFYSTLDNGPPLGIDWLSPPSGVPFDLPAEYDFKWKTVDEDDVIHEWHDATQCVLTFAGDWGGSGAAPVGFIECDAEAGDDWNCRCYKNSKYYDWSIIPAHFVDTSTNSGDACRLGASLCLTDLPNNNSTCYDSGIYHGYSARACEYDERCDYRHPTPHGEIVTSELLPLVGCSTFEGPEYSCLGSHIAGFGFEGMLDAVPRTIHATCRLAYDVFLNGVDAGSEGELTCTQSGRTTVNVRDGQESSCDARYQCRRPATARGEAIDMIYPTKTVNCSNFSGEWSCWCGGESPSYRYTDVDGVTACQTILDECMTHPIP